MTETETRREGSGNGNGGREMGKEGIGREMMGTMRRVIRE